MTEIFVNVVFNIASVSVLVIGVSGLVIGTYWTFEKALTAIFKWTGVMKSLREFVVWKREQNRKVVSPEIRKDKRE